MRYTLLIYCSYTHSLTLDHLTHSTDYLFTHLPINFPLTCQLEQFIKLTCLSYLRYKTTCYSWLAYILTSMCFVVGLCGQYVPAPEVAWPTPDLSADSQDDSWSPARWEPGEPRLDSGHVLSKREESDVPRGDRQEQTDAIECHWTYLVRHEVSSHESDLLYVIICSCFLMLSSSHSFRLLRCRVQDALDYYC